ncbi:MAG: DNA starvation/stationary phase protection protein [Planctomycetota bacterium]|nr:DNA starvation/stationary phase protection protein [Planctomycetota bacterium]
MQNALDKNLALLLADYQVLYQKLRNYHWNVKGPLFFSLHAKFEELYLITAERVDGLAERLAARGQRPPSTLAEHLQLARLAEDPEVPSAEGMVGRLVADLDVLVDHLREAVKVADQDGDSAAVNLLDGFADAEEQVSWMLRAFLG